MGFFKKLFGKDASSPINNQQINPPTETTQTTQPIQTTQNNPNNRMNQEPKVPEEVQRVNEVLKRCGSVMALVGVGLVNPETKELYSGYYIEKTQYPSGDVTFNIKLSQQDHLPPRGTIRVFSTGSIRLSGNSFAFDGLTRKHNIIQAFDNYGVEHYRAIEFYNDQGESILKSELRRDCQEIEKVSHTRSKPGAISQREELDISRANADIATLNAYDFCTPSIEELKKSLQEMRKDDSDYDNPNQRRWNRISEKISASRNMDGCLMYIANARGYRTTNLVQISVAEAQRAQNLDKQRNQAIAPGGRNEGPDKDVSLEYDFG